MSEFKFNDEPNIDMPAGAARAQLEAQARATVIENISAVPNDIDGGIEIRLRCDEDSILLEHIAEDEYSLSLLELYRDSVAALLVSFARAHGEAQYQAGLEAAAKIAHAEAHHWADFGNYKTTKARADSASDISKKIRALIKTQDGKAGE